MLQNAMGKGFGATLVAVDELIADSLYDNL